MTSASLVASNASRDLGAYVAVSADGNTAILGGLRGSYALVFTRINGIWGQQGSGLVGVSGTAYESQGGPVALSSDGNTALLGVPDSIPEGGAWVFSRIGSQWIQQGSKLAGLGASYSAQGSAVALSGDGKTALLGGPSGTTVFAITAPKATPSMAASSSNSLAPYAAQPSFTIYVIGSPTAGAIPTGAITLLVDGIAQ